MQCKIFSVPLDPEGSIESEKKLNEFLKAASVKRLFASTAHSQRGDIWTVMIFYDESASLTPPLDGVLARSASPANPAPPRSAPEANLGAAPPSGPPESEPPLTGEQVRSVIALKRWRADQAAQEGVPLYMVANNKWLEEIVRMPARGVQDLLKIRGLGEWRAKKYGAKMLAILHPGRDQDDSRSFVQAATYQV